MPAFDRIDFEILAELQKNARISNKELAEAVKLAPSTCLERVRRLEERGVIRGYHADIDPRAVGVTLQALIMIRVGRHSNKTIQEIREQVLRLREIIQFFHVTGSDDLIVHVAVRDSEHLRTLVLDGLSRDDVEHIETRVIFEYQRSNALPIFSAY